MSTLTIRRLHLAAQRDRHWGAQLLLERALAQASIAENKLVLVRRGPSLALASGKNGPTSSPKAQLEVRQKFIEAMEPIVARAVHGGTGGARQSAAVWFRDRGEALACFLSRLATGRSVDAWFWSAALPDGYAASQPSRVVERLLKQFKREGETFLFVLRAVQSACKQTSLPQVVEALAKSAPQSFAFEEPMASWATKASAAHFDDPKVQQSAPLHRQIGLDPQVSDLQRALARHPKFGETLRRAVASGDRYKTRMILLLLLGSFRSDLAASASKRGAILEGWSEAARDQSWQAQNELLAPRADLKRATPPPSDSQSSRDVDSVSWEDRTSSTPQPDSTAKADERDPSAEIGYEEHLGSEFGLNFRGAGLLLVIPALARTGYPEWLAARPSLQEQDAARLFLLSLFAHYSPQSLSSATRLLMGTRRSLQGPPHPELHQACLVWRKGIDGWLRRNAKCRLHDLGSIDGWLHEGVERHHLAFPLSAIHMGLRRKALDVDPGWVPWLGLCLGYLFAEHPETLGGEA